MSESTQRRRNLRVVSLNGFDRLGRSGEVVRLSDALADRKADLPSENVRRDLDYAEILDGADVSKNMKRVFTFLSESAGAGPQIELARELGVTPARVCQIKKRLAKTLAAFDYRPTTGTRVKPTAKKRGRPPGRRSRYLDGISLNVGTSPVRTHV